MPNRRAFLGTTFGALATSVLPALHAEEREPPSQINSTLAQIKTTLESLSVVHRVDSHLVNDPAVSLVHWRWMHFYPDIQPSEYRMLEQGNAELLTAMTAVRTMPDAGLDVLMHEGMVDGKVQEYLKSVRAEHEALVRMQRSMNAYDIDPKAEKIAQEMQSLRSLQQPVFQSWYRYDNQQRSAMLSPLAKLGVGYALSTQGPLEHRAAEDPYNDTFAEQAVRGHNPHYDYWVFWKRERHVVELLRSMKKKIVHVLFGACHNFQDDIVRSNVRNPDRLSEIVVTVNAIKDVPFITPRV